MGPCTCDDDPQWQDHTFVDFPIYVSKGRGKYHGQGGGLTSLLKLLFNKAKSNPVVRQQAKKLVKTGLTPENFRKFSESIPARLANRTHA
jgi:hypothetical protein